MAIPLAATSATPQATGPHAIHFTLTTTTQNTPITVHEKSSQCHQGTRLGDRHQHNPTGNRVAPEGHSSRLQENGTWPYTTHGIRPHEVGQPFHPSSALVGEVTWGHVQFGQIPGTFDMFLWELCPGHGTNSRPSRRWHLEVDKGQVCDKPSPVSYFLYQ